MLKSFDSVTVLDYGNNDLYHKSEEERMSENEFYHLFRQLRKMSNRPKDLPDVIIRLRFVLTALKEIAMRNGLLSPEKFIKDFFKEKISIDGLEIPKLKKSVRKKYNLKYIIDFAMSDQDPNKEFGKKRSDDVFTDVNITIEDLLPQDLIRMIDNARDDMDVKYGYFDDPDDQDGRNVALYLSKDDSKVITKSTRGFADIAKEMSRYEAKKRTVESALDDISRYVGDVREEDFDLIKAYDLTFTGNPYHIKEPEVPSEFTQDAVNSYLAKMDAYMEKTTWVSENGRAYNLEEYDEMKIKEALGNGLKAVLCIGESKYERQNKKYKQNLFNR